MTSSTVKSATSPKVIIVGFPRPQLSTARRKRLAQTLSNAETDVRLHLLFSLPGSGESMNVNILTSL